MFGMQRLFGCYDPAVLTSLQQDTNTYATTLNNIGAAVANIPWKPPQCWEAFGLSSWG